MSRRASLTLCVSLAAGFLAVPPALLGQTATDADALARRGRTLWSNRGCGACHGIGKKMAGPDIAGVSQRRTREWLGKFMKNTSEMLDSDSTAKALLREWKGVRMPQSTMSDADLDAVLAYIKVEEGKLKK